eukprot:CAMPEP_0114258554 /NCGR_PEP_ID=MMETSP0058-20121206/19394_1 /TAXON_ID=36894 /ORGANISM="Pyramimonas parkeae, CCMP726" /LENGTH=253 /DNA_ID=CAMNT_0001373487 /DNA_START=287 /DNA_END=1047 /DNA_ORIENTATION=+
MIHCNFRHAAYDCFHHTRKGGQLSHTSSEDGRRDDVPQGPAHIEPGSSNNAGLSQVDVSLMVYGCAALYLPAALYAAASFALTMAAFPAAPPSMAAAVAPLLQVVLGWFSQLAAAHHAMLNFCIACAFLPFLRSRIPRYARDHLLESNFMASLSLDLFPIFLHYAVVGRPLHFVTLALSLAMAALALFSAVNVLRINMQDPRDSMEARATTAIWALILMILGVCAKKIQYFIFILPLLWLRWQRYKFTQSRTK